MKLTPSNKQLIEAFIRAVDEQSNQREIVLTQTVAAVTRDFVKGLFEAWAKGGSMSAPNRIKRTNRDSVRNREYVRKYRERKKASEAI